MRASTTRWLAAAWIATIALADVGRAAPLIYGYDATLDHLVSFRADAPGTIVDDVALSGLQGDEYLLGIHVRPSTGELYGFATDGRFARLVVIDPATGVLTGVGVGDLAPPGVFGGVAFNPVADRLRVVTDAGSNQRWSPSTGALVATDVALAYDAGDSGAGLKPDVVTLAYVDHGSNPTTAYAIDATRDMLVRLGSVGGAPTSPNTGLLFTVGSLGFDFGHIGGFDIEPQTDAAYAVRRVAATGSQDLMTVDLATGGATTVGSIAADGLLDGIAIAPEPGAIAASCAMLAALGAIRRRRR